MISAKQLINNTCSSTSSWISLYINYNDIISGNVKNNYVHGISLYNSYNNTISRNMANNAFSRIKL